jgi:hypothetical protein
LRIDRFQSTAIGKGITKEVDFSTSLPLSWSEQGKASIRTANAVLEGR